MKHMKPMEIMDEVAALFPDAKCELNHRNAYEMAVAVILSAQTTDASVNRVTPVLFEKYPDIQGLSEADTKDVETIIASLGLYRNKAKSIVSFAKGVVNDFSGKIPETIEELTRLPGVGRNAPMSSRANASIFPPWLWIPMYREFPEDSGWLMPRMMSIRSSAS